MAVSGTYTAHDAIGIREDLSNTIYNISPEETPFMSAINRETASNTYFEWQTDALAAAVTTNAAIEGANAATSSVDTTVRVGNYTQISTKTVKVSNTLEAVNKAGRKAEMAYQLSKKSAELKRDMESTMLANQAAGGGSTSAARTTGGLPAWITTNVNKASNGENPTYTTKPDDPRTDGDQRAFLVTQLKDVIQKVWTSGGTPKLLMCGPVNRVKASGFAGIASSQIMLNAPKPTGIVASASVFVSDFGNLEIVTNRFQRERDAWVLDPEMAAVAYLRSFKTINLATAGDAESKQLVVEWGLKVNNEAAHGLVADLTTTA